MLLHDTHTKNMTCDTRFGAQRTYLKGSREVVRRVELGNVIVETIEATPGAFLSSFNVYATIVTSTPSHGPLNQNGHDITAPETSQNSYSLFCPGDTVGGVFIDNVIYDIVYLDPHWVDEIIASETDSRRIRLSSCTRATPSPILLALWKRIVCAQNDTATPAHELAQACLRLLVLLLAEPQLRSIDGKTLHRQDQPLTRAFRYIESNLDSRLSLDQIAKSADLSTFHFCRVFRRATNLSVRQFVMERRLEKARERLASTDFPICDIANECGFSSQSHLTTAFRTRYGTTPNVFRNGERS